MIKKILTNTIANYTLKFLQLILNLIAIPVLVNNLGEESFGVLLFAAVLVGYFNVLDLGIANGVTKYIAQYQAQNNNSEVQKVINTSLNFFIGIGFFVFALITSWVLLGGVNWINFEETMIPTYTNIFLLAGTVAIFSWPQMLLKGVFQGIQDFSTLNLTLGTGRVVSIILAILGVQYTDLGLEWIFIFFNLDKILLGFWQYFLIKKRISFWHFRLFDFNKTTFKSIFAFSGWIMLGQIAVLLEYQADQLIIIGFLSAAHITIYTVIFYLFRLIQQVSGLAASAIMPAISYINEVEGKEGVDIYIYKGVKYHNLFFVPITIACFFLAKPFIQLWMGDQYLEYVWLIQLSIAFQLIWQSSAMLGQIYIGVGFSRKPGIIAIIVGILNVAISIFLVKFVGIEGVILGTICVGTFSIPFALWWMLPDLKIQFWYYVYQVIFKTQLPLLITGVIIYLISWEWISDIKSWFELGITGIGLSVILFSIGYFTVVENKDKLLLQKRIKLAKQKMVS